MLQIYTHKYIYVCMCLKVCDHVCVRVMQLVPSSISFYIYTNMHVYINLCICLCVCVSVCIYSYTLIYTYTHTHACTHMHICMRAHFLCVHLCVLRVGLNPLKKEIHEILGSKREDRLSDPFFDLVQNTTLVHFFVPDSPLQFL